MGVPRATVLPRQEGSFYRADQGCLTIGKEQREQGLGQPGLETIRDLALNERDYGELSGLNKDEARKKWGEEQVHVWRRSYDIPPPGGESLKDTAARVLPYYIHRILPQVMAGKRTLVAAHGNSLRALIMAMEGLTPEQILARELDTGVPLVYRLNADTTIASLDVLKA